MAKETIAFASAVRHPLDFSLMFFSLAFFAAGGFFIRHIFGKVLARAFLPVVNGKSHKLEDKFLASLYKLFNYSFLLAVGIYTLYDEDWIFTPSRYIYGFPNNDIPIKIRYYYIWEFSSYLYSLIAMTWEPRLKDDKQMITHHFATLFLIGSSYHFGFLKYGTIIMIIHDFADPLMEVAKLFFYSNVQSLANLFFAAFAVTFIVTRDFVLPFVVIRTAFNDYFYVPSLTAPENCPWFVLPLMTLSALQILQLIWSGMIVRMVVETLQHNGVKGDIREDHDD